MEKKVSADTITELTAGYAVSTSGSIPPTPTPQQLIEDIRSRLKAKIEALAKSMQNSTQQSAFSISHGKAVADLQAFEKIVASPPKGFRLVPVLYSPIDSEKNRKIYEQFTAYVRRDFLRFLAEKHADELTALGIAPSGIERMKIGLSPIDQAGRLYDLNVDHIIERFGGGKASLTKGVDPLRPHGGATYIINHFSNFVLLPKKVHELKNKLNDMQGAVQTPKGEPKWVLMIVPVADANHSAYVAQPQKERLDTEEKKYSKRNNLSIYRVSPVRVAASTLEEINGIFESIAQAPEQKEEYESLLKPALDDMSVRLQTAFNEAYSPHHSAKSFNGFYEGKDFTSLRQKVDALPESQCAKLHDTIVSIDTNLKDTYNLHARRTANNKPKTPAPEQDNLPQAQAAPAKQSKKVRKHSDGSLPSRNRR